MFYRLLSEKWRPQDNDMETENDIALRRPSSTFRFLTQLYTPIATTFVCILLLLNLNQWHHSHKSWATPRIGQQDQEVIETIFTGSDKWESLDPKYDALWDQYGSGAEIMVKDMEVEQEDMIPASISMVHQLHCLGAFRKAIRDAKPLEGHKIDHLTHCLDYVRMVSDDLLLDSSSFNFNCAFVFRVLHAAQTARSKCRMLRTVIGSGLSTVQRQLTSVEASHRSLSCRRGWVLLILIGVHGSQMIYNYLENLLKYFMCNRCIFRFNFNRCLKSIIRLNGSMYFFKVQVDETNIMLRWHEIACSFLNL